MMMYHSIKKADIEKRRPGHNPFLPPRAREGGAERRPGPGGISRAGGFTLLEVLIALFIVTACLAPLSFYFYKSGFNQAAFEKYHAGQLLKREMHRAFLSGDDKKRISEIHSPGYFKVETVPVVSQGEICRQGTVFNRRGDVLAILRMCRYD